MYERIDGLLTPHRYSIMWFDANNKEHYLSTNDKDKAISLFNSLKGTDIYLDDLKKQESILSK